MDGYGERGNLDAAGADTTASAASVLPAAPPHDTFRDGAAGALCSAPAAHCYRRPGEALAC